MQMDADFIHGVASQHHMPDITSFEAFANEVPNWRCLQEPDWVADLNDWLSDGSIASVRLPLLATFPKASTTALVHYLAQATDSGDARILSGIHQNLLLLQRVLVRMQAYLGAGGNWLQSHQDALLSLVKSDKQAAGTMDIDNCEEEDQVALVKEHVASLMLVCFFSSQSAMLQVCDPATPQNDFPGMDTEMFASICCTVMFGRCIVYR